MKNRGGRNGTAVQGVPVYGGEFITTAREQNFKEVIFQSARGNFLGERR